MDSYARDLLAGDRAAIAARYDRRGAWFLGNGRKAHDDWAEIEASYATRWQPPRSFEWRDLSYEQTGSDTILVLGTFLWGPRDGGQPLVYSYTGLLVRAPDGLRIRLEDESGEPPR